MNRLTVALLVAAVLPLAACKSSQKSDSHAASMGAMNSKCPIMPEHKVDSAVTTDYKEHDNAFSGKIIKVTVDVKPTGEAVKAQAEAANGDAITRRAMSE